MRTLILGSALMAILTATAQAGPREQCAASTGATSGSAFNTCMAAAAKTPKKSSSGSYGSGSGRRGACRMSGTC
jgi:hypothetical protein